MLENDADTLGEYEITKEDYVRSHIQESNTTVSSTSH